MLQRPSPGQLNASPACSVADTRHPTHPSAKTLPDLFRVFSPLITLVRKDFRNSSLEFNRNILWGRNQRTKRSRNSDFKFIRVFSSNIHSEQMRDQEWEGIQGLSVHKHSCEMSTQSPFDSNSSQNSRVDGRTLGRGAAPWRTPLTTTSLGRLPQGSADPKLSQGSRGRVGWGRMDWEVGRGARREGTG